MASSIKVHYSIATRRFGSDRAIQTRRKPTIATISLSNSTYQGRNDFVIDHVNVCPDNKGQTRLE